MAKKLKITWTRSGIGAGYHARLDTSLPPLALAVGDVSGDATLDLVALEQAPSGGRIEAFATTDLVTFAAPWRVESAIFWSLCPNWMKT